MKYESWLGPARLCNTGELGLDPLNLEPGLLTFIVCNTGIKGILVSEFLFNLYFHTNIWQSHYNIIHNDTGGKRMCFLLHGVYIIPDYDLNDSQIAFIEG